MANVLLHFRAISTSKREINAVECMEPEILVFQVDETSNIPGGFLIDLRNPTNNRRQEMIGVLRHSANNLDNAGGVHSGGNGMLWNQERLWHSVMIHHIVPALA